MASNQPTPSGVPARHSLLTDADPFRDFFDQPLWLSRFFDRPAGAPARGGVFAPALDVHETKDAYVVTVELAGASKDDIGVESHDGLLTVKGEKKTERETEEEHRHYTERTYGAFSRSLRLPTDASSDLKASFRDGVLTIEIPKIEERKPKVVAIES